MGMDMDMHHAVIFLCFGGRSTTLTFHDLVHLWSSRLYCRSSRDLHPTATMPSQLKAKLVTKSSSYSIVNIILVITTVTRPAPPPTSLLGLPHLFNRLLHQSCVHTQDFDSTTARGEYVMSIIGELNSSTSVECFSLLTQLIAEWRNDKYAILLQIHRLSTLFWGVWPPQKQSSLPSPCQHSLPTWLLHMRKTYKCRTCARRRESAHLLPCLCIIAARFHWT